MLVFYYQYEGKTYCCCVRGGYPTRLSPIWKNTNTSVLMVPGTYDDNEENEYDESP